ncbi:MAG: DUF2235 domain-containing protein [Pseudomonadota bacterium]
MVDAATVSATDTALIDREHMANFTRASGSTCIISSKILIALTIVMLGGCSSVVHKPLVAPATKDRMIAIFFDGTHNDASSDTNVKKLHALVSLQDSKRISSLYIEGVGAGTDVLGMGAGLGIGARVRIAYAFLLDNYRPGDKIYIFGFSRGAYSARILVSLLYHAGFPTMDSTSPPIDSAEIADIVYDASKERLPEISPFTESKRQERVKDRLIAKGLVPDCELDMAAKGKHNDAVAVEVLGLWDTVEALGIPDWDSKVVDRLGGDQYIPNVGNGNPRYGDKLCNVRYVFHALALDDNREWVFTPQLMTRRHLFNGCTPNRQNPILEGAKLRKNHLHEVWFAGAHSDVGGGYPDSLLSGVSLNWMIEKLSAVAPDLLPSNAKVREDPYGTSHDPEAGLLWSTLYHAFNRDVVKYALEKATPDEGPAVPIPEHLNRGIVCVHKSVTDRRIFAPPKVHEYRQLSLRTRAKNPSGIEVDLVADDSADYRGLGRRREKTLAVGEGPIVDKITVSECPNGID